jgi:TP901 family phage tail tape measure protein
MAKTDLLVVLDADAAKLDREVQRATRSMQALEREIAKGNRAADKFAAELNQRTAQALQNVGRGMVIFGAAVVAGLGVAAKAAIDWESAWAGVRKTVEGSPEELAAVEAGLRDLATTLPATHQEIAAVAEAAGQLGVATPDIVRFTETMINLGETTNLSAEEAATAIAQLMNVMQTAPEDVGRLGAALVELGNNGASTERDIIEMAQRVAGAGQIIGLSEADVLALANALASVGIEAEAGGTAISTAMIKMAEAVAEGGESVQGFADVAGVSAQEFVQAFETDPARAIQMFVEGLARIDAAGGNVFGTLKDLELGNIRTRDALLRLAGAGDLLGESLDDGARAWEENTALIEEAEKRYDTAEAKIQIARNALVDLAIDVGGVLLPALSGLAEGATDLLRWFSDLPGPVKTVATIFGGLVGVLSLLGGGFLLLAPRLAAARTELQLLAATSPAAAAGLKATGVALRGLAIAGTVVAGVLLLGQALKAIGGTSKEVQVGAGEATRELLGLANGLSSELVNRVVEANEILDDSTVLFGVVGLSWSHTGKTVLRAADDMEAGLTAIDQALSSIVASGDTDTAKKSFNDLAAAWTAGGGDIDELRDKLPLYRDALANVSAQQQLTAETTDPLEASLQDLATQFGLTGEDAAKAAEEMLSAWSESFAGFVDVVGAYSEVLAAKEEAERKTAEETAAATDDASDSWEDYVGDVTVSIDEYLAELERQVQAQQDWQTNMLILSTRVSQGTLDQLARLGPEGAPLVEMLVDASDAELARFEELSGQRMEGATDNMADRLAEAGPVLSKIAAEHGQKVANSIARGMAQNGSTVYEEARRQGVNIDRGVGTDRTRNVRVNVPLPLGLSRADSAINRVARDRFTTVNVSYAVSGGLPAGLTRGHSGGLVTEAGIIPRFHAGASLTGLGRDEIPAILQTGERVLSRSQNAVFTELSGLLTRWQDAGTGTAATTMAGVSVGKPVVIELRSAGSRLDDLLVEVLRKSIRVKGGSVQTVLGS